MAPSAAKSYHESLLLTESPELLVNSRINPPAGWIYSVYEKWREENLGGLNSGLNFKRILETKRKEYQETGCIIEFTENPFSLIIITPLMQRVIDSIEGDNNSVFIDSTSSCDQAKSVLTLVLVASKAGALPVGVVIHECQTEENFNAVFSILYKEWIKIRPFSILNFMTDNSAALKAALHDVFPGVRQLLCQFHVPQAFWRWLWNSKHKVDNADRKPIMLLFRNIMYARTVHEFESSVDDFFGSDTVKKYDDLKNHVTELLVKRDEWCTFFRLNVKNHSHNTNNYSEATVRIFKEIVLTRLKAFNAIALMQFVINVFDNYLCKRILDTVYGRLKKSHIMFEKFLDKGGKILEKCLVEREENFFIVGSEKSSQIYTVDVGTCSCPIGIQGAFCKHQAAVHLKYGIMFPNAPVLSDSDKQIYYQVAVGKEPVSVSFLEPMMLAANGTVEHGKSSEAPFVSDNTPQALENANVISPSPPEELLSGQQISTKFDVAMKKISLQLKNCEDQGILSSAQNFLEKLDGIKNLSTLQKFFDGCHAASSRTILGRKIKVQPTSISRRKVSYRGSFCCRAGRPRQDAAEKIRKRARNLIKNININRPNATSHN